MAKMSPDEVRKTILETVSRNGGHLASSLGAVELGCALAEVFDPVKDRIVWDVGHQAYAWKIVTGRAEKFGTLRKYGGISPFMNPNESDSDAFISGHAGIAIAAAEGMACADPERNVVAVVGDAAIANGESFEALNNCEQLTKKLIIVLNDNEMSISRPTGAVAKMLGRLLTGVRYNRIKAAAERAGHRMRLTFLRKTYHKIESRIKSLWLANAFFEGFGLRYIGPVDGHDMEALKAALTVAKEDKRGVVVHVITKKGKGFGPAEANPTKWHGVGPFAIDGNGQVKKADGKSWSAAMGATLAELAKEDRRIHAITAAMKDGTGLGRFAEEFPNRFHDVGICEELAVSFAAGLAKAGKRPVVAIYSTFLQRAMDQIQHDVCLQNLPVVFAVDRAGCVGADGATHHGLYDVAMLKCMPNMRILAPNSEESMRNMLKMELAEARGPVAIRYPRGMVAKRMTIPAEDGNEKVLIMAVGDQLAKALKVRENLLAKGMTAAVRSVECIKPATRLADERRTVVSLENGTIAGGYGESIGADMKFGWPDRVIGHGETEELEREYGFDAESITEEIWRNNMA